MNEVNRIQALFTRSAFVRKINKLARSALYGAAINEVNRIQAFFTKSNFLQTINKFVWKFPSRIFLDNRIFVLRALRISSFDWNHFSIISVL